MQLVKYLILPLSLIFGMITLLRNKLYDWNILKSVKFNLPVISVGNLNVGGTGKTPLTEYLIRILINDYKIAVLSRGYKRKTKGYLLARHSHSYKEIGDEAKQVKNKFPEIQFAVDEKRVSGIKKLLSGDDVPEVIILDDAFQHRSLKPGLSVLLTDYYNMFTTDYLIPSGGLREFPSGADRADIIIVTKCPAILSPNMKRSIYDDIQPLPHQSLLFSTIAYSIPLPFNDVCINIADKNNTILLIAGIANISPLEQYLKRYSNKLITKTFSDHHCYTVEDWREIKNNFESIYSENKFICTTEKDIVKLYTPEIKELVKSLPVYYIPIEIKFLDDDELLFNKLIYDYVGKNKTNS